LSWMYEGLSFIMFIFVRGFNMRMRIK